MTDGAPQINHLAVQLHVHLVQVPSPVTKASHVAHALATDLTGDHRSEPIRSEPHGLVADVDAALEQQILDIP